jgi:ABC-type transport system involved in multi-copper enzyme maturation permease subunit
MNKIFAIAVNTAREAIRNRILYSILFFAVFVIVIAGVFGAASIGDQMKFVKDFSLMSVSLFSVIIAVVVGVNMLNQELRKKTIFNILSKPVARWQFIAGKFLGLLATLTLIIVLMCSTLVGFLTVVEGKTDVALVVASAAALLEIMIVIAVALFFSSLVVTPTLAGLFTAATFVAGRSAGYVAYFLADDHAPAVQVAARVLSWILPRLDLFTVADQAVYGDLVTPGHFLLILAYSVAYSGLLLLLSAALFHRREFT